MSIAATTRPPLSTASLPAARSPAAVATTLTTTAFAITAASAPSFGSLRHTMHPDDLLLQQHGVASPRLSAEAAFLKAPATAGAMSGAASGTQQRRAADERQTSEEDDVMIDDVDDIADEEAEDTRNACRRRQKQERRRCGKRGDICDNDDEDAVDEDCDVGDRDAVSLCGSEDSELSVGHEGHHEEDAGGSKLASCLQQQMRRLPLAVSDMMSLSLCRPSAFSSVGAAAALMDVSDLHSTSSADDAAQQQLTLDPFAVAANALRMPVPLVPRVSSAQLQEELLRKSHLYAEELMKQQMQLMAVARASAFSQRQPANATACHRTQPPSAQTQSGNTPNFCGIQSHLSAISKMTQLGAAAAAAAAAVAASDAQTGAATCCTGSDALAQLTAFGRRQTATPATATSNLSQLQAQMQARLPFMNDNLQEPALKFSIDNILKADFGRRITDPLLKRAAGGGGGGGGGGNASLSGTNAARAARPSLSQQQQRARRGGPTATAPMDLTSQMTAAAASVGASAACPAAPFTQCAALTNHCLHSDDSSSTVISGGCGGHSERLKSPASLGTGAASSSVCSGSPVSPAAGTGFAESGRGGECATAESEGGGGHTASSSGNSGGSSGGGGTGASGSGPIVWPAWVYCTRYSDRPSSGRSPRARKPKKPASEKSASPAAPTAAAEDKRPRTAFSGSQLARLKHEFTENRYLTEKRRQQLSAELGLNEAQIKIWFQNKRAKLKKSSGTKNPLALQLMAQGLYNHSTIPLTREEEELQELQERESAGTVSS